MNLHLFISYRVDFYSKVPMVLVIKHIKDLVIYLTLFLLCDFAAVFCVDVEHCVIYRPEKTVVLFV